MFALLDNNLENKSDLTTEVIVEFFNSCLGKIEKRVFRIELNGAIVDSTYHKICVDKILKNEDTKEFHYVDGSYLQDPQFFEKISLRYQVLSPKHTSFLMLIEKNENKITEGEEKAEEILVPNIESVDYNALEGRRPPIWARGVQSGGVQLMAAKKYKGGGGGSCCGGGGGSSYSNYSPPSDNDYGINSGGKPKFADNDVINVIEKQNADGSWSFDLTLLKTLKKKSKEYKEIFMKLSVQFSDKNLLMSFVIYGWLISKKDDGSLMIIIAKLKKYLREKASIEGFDEKLAEVEKMWE